MQDQVCSMFCTVSRLLKPNPWQSLRGWLEGWMIDKLIGIPHLCCWERPWPPYHFLWHLCRTPPHHTLYQTLHLLILHMWRVNIGETPYPRLKHDCVTAKPIIWWEDTLATQHNTTQHNTTQHNTTQHNTTEHIIINHPINFFFVYAFIFSTQANGRPILTGCLTQRLILEQLLPAAWPVQHDWSSGLPDLQPI